MVSVLSRWLSGKESTCQCRSRRGLGFSPGLGRYSGRGNAKRSGTLAWELPQTEEPGGLQSTGSQRVGRNWAHMHVYLQHWIERQKSELCVWLNSPNNSKIMPPDTVASENHNFMWGMESLGKLNNLLNNCWRPSRTQGLWFTALRTMPFAATVSC